MVGYARLEQVCGEGVVEAFCRLLRPLRVQLHAVGLDGDPAVVAQSLGELGQRLPRSAAGVEDAERLHAPVVGVCGGGHSYQLGDQVRDPLRCGVEAPFGLTG